MAPSAVIQSGAAPLQASKPALSAQTPLLKASSCTSSTIEPSLVTRMPTLDGGDAEEKRAEIRRYFHDTFTLYESLYDCLSSDEAFYARANPVRHPLIFYYGHTAVFFINKLNVAHLITHRINPRLESMLAVGVNEESWDDLDETHYDWPTPAEVCEYRAQVRKVVDEFIQTAPLTLPIGWDDPFWIILMGIEHERIHLETSSVLIRELALHHTREHPVWGNICTIDNPTVENKLIPVQGGPITLGKSRDNDQLYGWDNEYGTEKHDLKNFEAAKYLVSNAEYRPFVEENGYKTERYWTEEGWRWASSRGLDMPVYWVREGEDIKLRTMLRVIDLPSSWPVEVNYLEAKAFCNWKAEQTGQTFRLPTEAEWYRLRSLVNTDQPYWREAPGNINLEGVMSPCPVDTHAFEDGFYDLIGNVWQWTDTVWDGYDGFEVHEAYDDFSVPALDGSYTTFKGGCWVSTGNYSIRDSRYGFRRHFHQHSGFRYIVGGPLPRVSSTVCETNRLLSHTIDFHFGKSYLGVPNFPARCAQLALAHVQQQGSSTHKALEIGCASGRSSFELAKVFDHVDALDFSVRSFQAAVVLQRGEKQRYMVEDEGEIQGCREVQLKDFDDECGYTAVRDRIQFAQADACNLLEKYSDYDFVFGANVIDFLYEPDKFLQLIKGRINAGGLLALSSTYNWTVEVTPRENWLGGFKDSGGENLTTRDALARALEPEFELVAKPVDVEFVWRQTRRRFEHGFSELSVWRKVSH